MKTILVLVILLLLGGITPTGTYSAHQIVGAVLLSAAALLVLFVACVLSGCATAHPATKIIEIEHAPATAATMASPAVGS